MSRVSTRTAVSVVAVAAIGFGACSSADDPQDPGPVAPEGQVEPVGPRSVTNGVPQGWRRDSAGARAAAMSAVALTGDVARAGFITRGDMIDGFASTRFASELTERTDQQLAELAEALGESPIIAPLLTWTEVPLTATIPDDGGATTGSGELSAVQVEVWSVIVVAAPEVQVPRQAWRTVTVDLVWEDDDWRVDGWDSQIGPTPALTPATAVSSTDEVVEVAEWPPAHRPERMRDT